MSVRKNEIESTKAVGTLIKYKRADNRIYCKVHYRLALHGIYVIKQSEKCFKAALPVPIPL